MRSPALRLAVWLTTTWTWAYTCGLDPIVRDSRRREIESDLWECQHDEAESDAHIARHVVVRLVGGALDDLRWRADHPWPMSGRALVAVGTTGVVVVALWMLFLTQLRAVPIPTPVPLPTNFFERFSPRPIPPPPPPPPPPPAPCPGCPKPFIDVHEEMRVTGNPR